MKRSCIVMVILLLAPASYMWSQCDGPNTVTYGTSYALRTSAEQVYVYSQTWVSGPDEPYDYTWDYQDDYFNTTPVGPELVGSANPGNGSWAQRTVSVNLFLWGQYVTNSLHVTYDACTGAWMPPYASGSINGQTAAKVWVYEPTINGNSRVWLHGYGANYPNTTVWTANTGGAPETPTWFFVNGNQLQTSCTTCSSVTISALPSAPSSCTASIFGYYVVGGLSAPSVGAIIDSPVQVAFTDQSGQHVDNIALKGVVPQIAQASPLLPIPPPSKTGYDSVWSWKIQDQCGTPMGGADMHEEFPQGFAYDPSNANSNWPFPTANSWSTGDDGSWYDNIGEALVLPGSPAWNPVTLIPQSPLTTNVVYAGPQNVYVGNNNGDLINTQVFNGNQAHYQDHGGYK